MTTNTSEKVDQHSSSITTQGHHSPPSMATRTTTTPEEEEEEEEEVEHQDDNDDDDDDANEALPTQPSSPTPTPMPWNALIIVVLIHVADLFSFTTLAPYIVDLVQDMGLVPDGDKRKIGYYAGLIGSSYYVAQFFSAFVWGFISDRFGRRIVLLVGVGGSSITSLMFGFSKRLYWCLLSRILFGLVNGNLGTYKVMLSELSDRTNQARVFSYLGVAFTIGNIVGPLIGGFLADPMKQYPALNEVLPQNVVRFLVYFPFLLPNVVVCLNNVLAFVLAFLFLKETNPAVLKTLNKDHLTAIASDQENEEDEKEEEMIVEEDLQQEMIQPSADPSQPIAYKLTWKQRFASYFQGEIFATRYPLIMVAVYSIIGFSSVIFAECIPLMLALKPEFGGIDFNQKQIGILNGACGVIMFFWQIFVCARIVKALGAVRSYQWMTLIHIPVYVFFPMVNYVYSTPWLMWTLLISLYTIRNAVSQVMFASMMMLTNNSVTSVSMGKLNGISQSAVAFTRAIAPSLGGVLFSWSLTVNVFPINIYFVWIFTSLTFVVALVIVIGFPASLNEPKQLPSAIVEGVDNHSSYLESQDESTDVVELVDRTMNNKEHDERE